jgi:excisionase family DNA binding protein
MNTATHTQQTEWLDLKQAEREFPLSRRTLWTWISSGRLPAYKPFRKTLVKRSDLVRMLESTRIGVDLGKLVDETVAEVLRK